MPNTAACSRQALGTLPWITVTVFVAACTTASPGSASAPGAGPTTATPAATSANPSTAAPLTVVIGDFAEPNSLNPALSTESPRVSRQLFLGLVAPDPTTGAPVPDLAASWDLSTDGLTYSFHIRPNVKWSDGQPFTADDAKFTFDLIRDPKNAIPFKTNFDQITSTDVVDPLTLRLTLAFRKNFGRTSASESAALSEALFHRAPERLSEAAAGALGLTEGETPIETVARLAPTECLYARAVVEAIDELHRATAGWLDLHLLLPILHLGQACSLAAGSTP